METCRQPSRPPLPPGPPPLLPPPPPPPPPQTNSLCPHGPPLPPSHRLAHVSQGSNVPWWRAWMKKYVVLCLICGGLSVLLGLVLIGIYFTLRSYTSSLQFFETIPTYVPAVVLIITGLIVMCFAKRRNRYAYLIKLAGGCCLICALLCVVITVTTTVIHMNRLQTLHECVYNSNAKTCMCVSAIADTESQDGAHRFVFNNTPNCEVVHGSLYACLRALFGLSVIGILVCIFSSMLVYQLLSHEKKKIYWEQLELRRRFLYQRHPNHTFCGCYDDLYPWQLWEMLDYRFLNPLPLSSSPVGEEESPPHCSTTGSNGLRGGGLRASGWNWLPWPWHDTSHRGPSANRSNNTPRQSFMRRLISRDSWGQQLITLGGGTPRESPVQSDSPGISPWRSECVHIFRPSSRDGNACAPPVRFGIRSRSAPYGRTQGGHRRTRSNDGVFHHLHMNPTPRFAQSYPLSDGTGTTLCHYSNYEIPRYMWGPPPPYSHPPSVENIAVLEGNNTNQNSHRSCGLSEFQGTRGNEGSHGDSIHATNDAEQSGTGSHSSKLSTPLSERRFLCHNFSSEGITLTIGSNFSDVCSQNEGNGDYKHDDTCIVEVHVPYIFHKSDIVFNTLPTRSSKKKDLNPFKSLSNIPLCLTRKLNGLKQEINQTGHLSVITTCCEIKEGINCSLESIAQVTDLKQSVVDGFPLKTLSEQHLFEDNSTNTSPITETSPSSLSFQPTMVEIPSDFKSSLVIATSPSTPVTENITLTEMVYAQSMPNLSLSNSPTVCSIHRVPSSGNTSTSQDFADFELEEDSSPLVLHSPVTGIPRPPSLPDDNATDSSSSSSCHGHCPHRLHCFKGESATLFSNESSPVSCEVTVGCFRYHCTSSNVTGGSGAVVGEVIVTSGDGSEEPETDPEFFSSDSSPSGDNCGAPPISSSQMNRVSIPSKDCHAGHAFSLAEVQPIRQLGEGRILRSSEIPETTRGSNLHPQRDRTNNFIVTIKSINV